MIQIGALVACLLFVTTSNQQASARVTNFELIPSNQLTNDNAPIDVHLIELAADNEETQTSGKSYTPVLFWHGMGDTAYGSINVDRLALQKKFPGMKVFSIQIGSSASEDAMAGYFANMNQQIDEACKQVLRNDRILQAKALNVVGFSQGGQFVRALVQRCPLMAHGIKVKNLITLGGQHQGVFGLPRCQTTTFCEYIRYMLSTGAYNAEVQEHLVQAAYWHDPKREETYKAKNIFLPDINNENYINQTYKDNLLALEHLVLVQFLQDEMVVPRESSLFGFYKPDQDVELRPLEESPLYVDDRLGLKQLNESGRLKQLRVAGKHLQYKMSWFLDEIAAKYLDN